MRTVSSAYTTSVAVLVVVVLLVDLASATSTPTAENSDANKKSETYYSIIGVDLNASEADIKKAYRTLAKTTHPDRARTKEKKEEMHHKFVKLGRAYQILSDEITRARYDYLLSKGQFEYQDMDWREFDKKRGFNRKVYSRVRADGEEEFIFKDAYQQFQDVAEERALFVSLLFTAVVSTYSSLSSLASSIIRYYELSTFTCAADLPLTCIAPRLRNYHHFSAVVTPPPPPCRLQLFATLQCWVLSHFISSRSGNQSNPRYVLSG